MSRGDQRRLNDLENFESEFMLALERAKLAKVSAYLAEKRGQKRGAADALDVELFTLESKIARLREKLGLPRFVVPITRPAPEPTPEGWPAPPELEATVFPLDLSRLHHDLAQSGREPEKVFAKARYAGAKNRQGADQPGWRLCQVEVGDRRMAELTLTVHPLPEHPDAELAARKLQDALEKMIRFCERAAEAPARERPRVLHVTYTREGRELAFHAR